MGRKRGTEVHAEPATTLGIMTADPDTAPGVMDAQELDAPVPADDESTHHELGTEDPRIMSASEIRAELDRTEKPGDALNRARLVFEDALRLVEQEREELKLIEASAHNNYAEGKRFAEQIAKRRQALENEERRRGYR